MNKENPKNQSRRKFIYTMGMAGLSVPILSAMNCNSGSKSTTVSNSSSNKKNGKLGVALVGLGSYATGQLAPALQQTEHCYLAGIVTGTPAKADKWKQQYNIPDKNIYNYENYDSIKDNKDIDIIYVVLPNSMHAEYTIRGAQAGKHMTCEKPMAISVAECDQMIAACKKAGKMLSIGYRLHFDPYNLEMVRLSKEKVYGNLKKVSAGFGFNAQKGIWRLDKKMAGGGPLMDLGVYCLQGICYITGKEPIAVTAQQSPISDPTKFIGVEETLRFQMEMPDGIIGEAITSYSEGHNHLRAEAEKGWFELQPSYSYSGLKGKTSDGRIINFPAVNQQARQMDAFALAITNNQPNIVPGEMGRRDLQIITAIYEAMNTGKRVEVKR